jgi:flavin reductase (DIM6/NTAB) family NADH-FMN oxidoreductase RutF
MADGARATTASTYTPAFRTSAGQEMRRHMTAIPNGSTGSPVSTPVTDIDGLRFRSVLGRFATGVVAITAIEQETSQPTGLIANSFTSVSLDPPLVAFCVAHTSSTWPRLRLAGRICINILSEPQLEVSRQLSTKGGDKFAAIDWTASPGGSPVISQALAWIECTIESEYPAGDHMIVVARVRHLDKHHEGEPLLFYRGSYGRFDG